MIEPRGTICWSGEVFVAALPRDGEGIIVLAIDEAGSLVRPAEIIPHAGEMSGASFIACPDGGPVFIAASPTWPGIHRIHHIRPDGSPEGTFADSDFPPSVTGEGFNFINPNTVSGSEVVVPSAWIESSPAVDEPVLVFISRDGTYRLSEALSVEPWPFSHEGVGLARTDEGIAVVWAKEDPMSGKSSLLYALFSLDGGLLVPPMTTFYRMGEEYQYWGVLAASSGPTVLVAAELDTPYYETFPSLCLLDLDGSGLAGPVLADPAWADLGFHPSNISLFWEGDAYATIWSDGHSIGYRRFLVDI